MRQMQTEHSVISSFTDPPGRQMRYQTALTIYAALTFPCSLAFRLISLLYAEL